MKGHGESEKYGNGKEGRGKSPNLQCFAGALFKWLLIAKCSGSNSK